MADSRNGNVYLPDIKVFMMSEARAKQEMLIAECPKEIGWFGLVDVTDSGVVIVEDLIVPEQEVTASEVDYGEDGVALDKLLEEYADEAHRIKFFGHSHVNMDVYHSGTDLEFVQKMGEMGLDFFVTHIANKKGEHITRIDVWNPIRCAYKSMLHTMVPETVSIWVEEQMKEKVTIKETNYSSSSSSSSSKGTSSSQTTQTKSSTSSGPTPPAASSRDGLFIAESEEAAKAHKVGRAVWYDVPAGKRHVYLHGELKETTAINEAPDLLAEEEDKEDISKSRSLSRSEKKREKGGSSGPKKGQRKAGRQQPDPNSKRSQKRRAKAEARRQRKETRRAEQRRAELDLRQEYAEAAAADAQA